MAESKEPLPTRSNWPVLRRQPASHSEPAEAAAPPGAAPAATAEPPARLPVYDSMAACSGGTGIPGPVLKKAKKAGCSAFSNNRVSLEPLLRFLFSDNGGADDVDWGDRLRKFQSFRQEIAYERDKGATLTKSEVKSAIARAMAALFSAMERRSTIELPTELRGLDAPGIQKRLLTSDEALKTDVRATLEALSADKEPEARKGRPRKKA